MNNLNAFLPEAWSTNIVQRINQTNVMLGLTNTEYEGEIKAAGDVVWVRTFGDVTMSPYTRGASITYNDLAPVKEPLKVNDSKYFAFNVDDLDKAQSDIQIMDGYSERAAVSINNVIEAKLQGYYSFANPANQISNAGAALTIDNTNAYTTLVLAGQALTQQNVPRDGRWAILPPTYESAILQDAKYFIRATDMGDRIVMSGRPGVTASTAPGLIGRAAGFDLYSSNATYKDAAGRYAMFGQGKPISYASQIREMEALRLETTFATAVRGLLLHDATVFSENAKKLGYIWMSPTQ